MDRYTQKLIEIVEVIEDKSNQELAKYIKDDLLTDKNFGLSLSQARFLLEVAKRLEACEPSPKSE